MKEPYRKGLASHPGPESCAGSSNAAREALTGAHADQPLSCEIKPVQGADVVSGTEGKTEGHDPRRVPGGPCAVEDPVYAWKLLARNLGDPKSAR
jgi:hypothetical protein